jgi:serine phosphatase RsbU (regulator of sigma subunit)
MTFESIDKSKNQLLAELLELRHQRTREKASEHIRAEVLSMVADEDLLRVVGVMQTEMLNLGIQTPASSISFMNQEEDLVISYLAGKNPAQYGLSWTSPDLVEINEETAVFASEWAMSEGWRENHAKIWREGEPGTWHETVTVESFVERGHCHRLGIVGDPSEWAKFLVGDWHITCVPFQHGTVAYREREHRPEHIPIVQELAEAVSLGYLRFLDLKNRDQAQQQLISEMERELQTAHEMQMALMPKEAPALPGLEVSGHCRPAKHVGGDFFQYFPLARHRLAIGMADVTGHAMEAAIPVVMFSGILKSETRHGNPLEQLFANLNIEQLFANLNQTLCETLGRRTFVCFTLGEVDLNHGIFRHSNSGCPYPLHFRADRGEITELAVDAYPLGIQTTSIYPIVETRVDTGDYIIFCSDGIIEACDPQDQLFGFERTAETVRQGCIAGLAPDELISHIFAAVDLFRGEASQGDDMTCVALKLKADQI